MRRLRKIFGAALMIGCMVSNFFPAYAGWEPSGGSYRYRNEEGAYVYSRWVNDNGVYYYLDQNGMMMANTTTPDGYLVAEDGSWVQDKQVLGGYVRTPYDNAPYWYREDTSSYIFDEDTDALWNGVVLAAVRGIYPVEELSEMDQAVYQKVNEFLVGFPYGASEYDKAKRIYNYLQSVAVYGYSDATNLRDSAYGALVKGEANCVGFAYAYKLLANAVGLRCGTWSNSSHMWNEVYIDGTWKYVDVSSIGTSAEFFLDMSEVTCPYCGYIMTFGSRELEMPCRECGKQVRNPNLDIEI